MSNTNSASSGGVSILGLLGVVFVTLKLLGITEVATWSWWWVTAPFWGGIAVAVSFFIAVVVFAGLVALISEWR